MFKVILTSVCGTYRETLKCKTIAEAEQYAAAAIADGEWTAKIVAPK